MRVGVDGRKIPRAREYGPFKSFDHGRELGMEGLFFRTVLEMSYLRRPTETLFPPSFPTVTQHA